MLDKHYQPHQLESLWYQQWTDAELFKKVANRQGAPSYCIMIPPPNVTGTLHMGHAFQDTLMDILVRTHAQKGFNVLWQVGTDHAGIATQMVVERLLEQRGLKRHDMTREDFLTHVWQWKEQSGGQILSQLKRLGTFIDWDKERFTMDASYNKAVLEAFVRLYRDKLIYRKQRLVNWDCHLQSAVSDLEVEFHEEQGFLYHIEYKIVDGSGSLVVATTRPETLFGDVAVAVHPEDERYQALIGKELSLPLTDRSIPIIADEHVDREFGTGCVKITPGHDLNDFAMGERHGLPLINILHKNGQLNEHAHLSVQGLDRLIARPLIVKALESAGNLKFKQPHSHQVPRCSRTDQVIEPLLTEQWYVSMKGMADQALQAHNQGQLSFIPQAWEKHYQHWLTNIQDWCISRQLWWGHQIPAWYDHNGNIYVGMNEQEVRSFYELGNDLLLTQDQDVLDTWFSSALWPFATLGWPEDQSALEKFFPTNVLVTGFDIIFFWVARMVMFSLYFKKKVPFNDIYIHGLIQDHQGVKMSKSKGNVIDPIDLIDGISLEELLLKRTQGLMQPEKAAAIATATRRDYPAGLSSYGADALRLTFTQQASPGRFIRFDTQRLQASQNFCNKLWNMMRFTLMQLEGVEDLQREPLHPINQWILSVIIDLEKRSEQALTEYRFDLLGQMLVETIWTTVCDHYLEFAKVLLKDDALRGEAQATLINVVSSILGLLHPIMPFITEELSSTLHHKLYPHQSYTHLVERPALTFSRKSFEGFESTIPDLIELMTAIRTIRSKMDIPPKVSGVLIVQKEAIIWEIWQNYAPFISDLTKVSSLRVEATLKEDEHTVSSNFKEEAFFLSLPVSTSHNLAQLERLKMDYSKCLKEIEKARAKLNNEAFVSKAPAAVIEQEKQRLSEYEVQLRSIEESLKKLS